MTTLQNLVDQCRDTYLYAGSTPELGRLGADCTAGATSIIMSTGIGSAGVSGTRLAIGYEELRAWANDGNQTFTTVDRGVGGSTAASHSNGDLVEIAPQFSQYRVLREINSELDALSAEGIFAVGETEVTYNPAVQGYDLGSIAWEDIIDLRYEIPGPSKNWPPIRSYAKLRNADTTQFPSGNGVIVYEPGWAGLPIRIRWRGTLTHLANPTDDVSTTGLQASAYDLPVIGAAMRLLAGMEFQRVNPHAQRDPMLNANLPPGALGGSVKNLIMLRGQRVLAEANRLARLYPRISPR